LKKNKTLNYNGLDILNILKEIEYILCSLHDMGAYFTDKDRTLYEKETTEFIDNSLVCDRLANIRYVLCQQFDLSLGNDEMDDIERVCENLPYWSDIGNSSIEMWLK
jgi:hypothetical protein